MSPCTYPYKVLYISVKETKVRNDDIISCVFDRGVRGQRQETRKNTMKLGKNAKNRLKIKEKAEILAQKICQNQGNQLKRGTLTPLV